MTDTTNDLRDTKWLAWLLGVHPNTLEKRRSTNSDSLPASIYIGRSVRYDVKTVYAWLGTCKVIQKAQTAPCLC